jgi:hypothetical protein
MRQHSITQLQTTCTSRAGFDNSVLVYGDPKTVSGFNQVVWEITAYVDLTNILILQPWVFTRIKIQYVVQGFRTFHGNKILWHRLVTRQRLRNETTTVARQRPAYNNASTVGDGVFCVVRSETIWLNITSSVPLDSLLQCDLGWNGCSKGTPITKKAQPLPFIKGGTTKEEKKTKVLTLNTYMAMGPSGARCQEWPCWLVAGSKLLLYGIIPVWRRGRIPPPWPCDS